jgi:Phosphatidylinositol N-acetylglucosaminyltransferase
MCHLHCSRSAVRLCDARTCLRVQGTLSPGTLLLWNLLGAAVLLTSAVVLTPQLEPEVFGRAVRRGLLLLAGTYLLSPLLQVLYQRCAGDAVKLSCLDRATVFVWRADLDVMPRQTLTRTTSSDTILALAIAMLLAHLFLHDYRLQVSLTSTASGAASLAAAIFASVVIASRLSSQLHVFSQVPIYIQASFVPTPPFTVVALCLHPVAKLGVFARCRCCSAWRCTSCCRICCIRCTHWFPLQPLLHAAWHVAACWYLCQTFCTVLLRQFFS